MKKWLIGIICSLIAILTTAFILSSAIKSNAVSLDEQFQIEGENLVKYYGQDEVCVIPDKVKAISASAFEGNEFVKRVKMPDGLETIEYNAFSGMPNLERVVIPDSVTRIGSSAFADCPKLTSVYLGKNIAELGACPFAGCTSLQTVELNEYNENLTCVDGVIYSSDRKILYEMLPGREKEYFIFPDIVNSISPYAFWGCDKLMYVTASDSLENIGAYAFSNAESLLSISLSFNTKEIGMKAFENCQKLVQVYIPDSCKAIHDTAFDGCKTLSIYTNLGTDAEKYANEKSIPVIYKPIYDLNMATVSREKELELEKIKKHEAENPPAYDPSKDNPTAYTYVVDDRAVILMDPEKLEVYSGSSTKASGSDYDSVLKESLVDGKIPENLFYMKKELSKIDLPEDFTEIGKFSFARTGISEIIIPDGVEKIDFGAFYHCDNLMTVSIPDSVKIIEKNAFAKTLWLDDWYENGDSDYLIVGDGVLLAYKGDKESFVMPENVKYVSCDID